MSLLLGMSALGAAGCDWYGNMFPNAGYQCPGGATVWLCQIKPTPCHMALANYVCASDMASAIAEANAKAIETLKPRDQELVGTTCSNTGATRAPESFEPDFHTLDECDPTGIGGGAGAGGGAPTCGGPGALCEDSSACCTPLVCSLNVCD